MKFLVDAHLPYGLCCALVDLGHEAKHTRELPEGNRTSDQAIVRLAVRDRWVVVTKDSDFYFAQLVPGNDFRLLLVRTGNLRAAVLVELFRRHLAEIIGSLREHRLVELDADGPRTPG